MDISDNKIFYLDKWQVAPHEGKLICGAEIIHLEPRAMEVLVYLASRPDAVVTREELERNVWRGALVGYDAVTNTIIKLRKALDDNARDPHIIATIPKKGYQLIANVQYPGNDYQKVVLHPDAFTTSSISVRVGWFSKKPLLFILTCITLASLVALWFSSATFNSNPGKTSPDRLPSIVVLPFENLNNDSIHDYLANGLTEDIITDLSALSNIVVIASRIPIIDKSEQFITQRIQREHDISFLLKGSIRVIGDTIRVNTQLVNASNSITIWADRYDRKITEVFDVQDELTQRIIESLTVKLTTREKHRLALRATSNLKAYDLFQEGQRMQMQQSREALQHARDIYELAIEIDPNYGRAYGAMAITLLFDYQNDWTDSQQETLDRALVLAKQAVALDSETPQTHWALSLVHLIRGEYQLAEDVISHTINASPNYADGIALLGLIKAHQGDNRKTIELISKGMQLNPFYSWQYLLPLGIAYYQQENFEQSITVLEEAKLRNENATRVKVFLAASYLRANRKEDAEWLVNELTANNPTLDISFISNTFHFRNKRFKSRFLNDLKLAGFHQ